MEAYERRGCSGSTSPCEEVFSEEVGGMIVCLHRSGGLLGALIRWQTRSPYSHASMLIEGKHYESVAGKGVVRSPLSKSAELFLVDGIDDTSAASFVDKQLGKGYDYSSVLRFVSRKQASRKSSRKWFCSELVYATCQKGGIELLRAVAPWEVSPGMLSRSPLLKEMKSGV